MVLKYTSYKKEKVNMRSIIINAPKDVRIIDKKPMPEPKEGEVLLKVLYGGICGSDLGSYRGTFAYFSYPQIPGHEFSAEVIKINSKKKTNIKEGMIVVCNPYFNCKKCYSCSNGHVNACQDNQTMGVQREGAFSEYITMPVERVMDGRGIDAKTLALIEPFCIARHGVKRANAKKGDKVLIVGAGTIGICAALYARSLGADVYLSDISQEKLDYTKNTFGFEKFILNDENFIAGVQNATENNGFDITIEAVGLPSTFQNCIDAAAFCAKVVLIGVGKKNLDFNFTILQKKELNVFGSRNSLSEDFNETIDDVLAGKIKLDKLISQIYPLDDAPSAFADFSSHSGEWTKVLIDFTK